jgi:membrane associated rhomboid family serine protease
MGVPVRSRLSSSFVFFGARFPAVVVWLAGGILAASCLGALADRLGLTLLDWVVLHPQLVLKGQLWRLVTWSFFELSPLGLIFGCLLLLMIGRDLADSWGARRFLVIYVVLTAVVGALTVLVGLVWPDVQRISYVTMWPLLEALIIAWAVWFPSRQILVYFVLPMGGRNLILLTIGGTLIFALLVSVALFVPHFLAEGLMLAYLRVPAIGRVFQKLSLGMRGNQKRRPTHLRAVDRMDREDEPPRWLH